jgi:hypothetical protein
MQGLAERGVPSAGPSCRADDVTHAGQPRHGCSVSAQPYRAPAPPDPDLDCARRQKIQNASRRLRGARNSLPTALTPDRKRAQRDGVHIVLQSVFFKSVAVTKRTYAFPRVDDLAAAMLSKPLHPLTRGFLGSEGATRPSPRNGVGAFTLRFRGRLAALGAAFFSTASMGRAKFYGVSGRQGLQCRPRRIRLEGRLGRPAGGGSCGDVNPSPPHIMTQLATGPQL